jgi:hypothetical protein
MSKGIIDPSSQLGSVRRGVCPACLNPIARRAINVTQKFKCPHCQQLVKTSNIFRAFVYIACYGVPTVIVFCLGRDLVASVVLWAILVFACSVLYIQIATRISVPRLELFRRSEDFQSLHLGK